MEKKYLKRSVTREHHILKKKLYNQEIINKLVHEQIYDLKILHEELQDKTNVQAVKIKEKTK